MVPSSDPIAIVRECLRAIERGATGEDFAKFYDPGVVQAEFPNRLVAQGARRDLAAILDAAERGRKIVANQRFDIRNAVANGDHVAIEAFWEATLRVALGTLPAGGKMKAHFAVFFEFRQGRTVAQRNYDCFMPW
ncbi:MAG: nuclear transport factor 2 family protein [Rhodospirillaceae bacterium]|nr:nuclear transport factor 2 family protein [Rhodospirillaceae bacterium]